MILKFNPVGLPNLWILQARFNEEKTVSKRAFGPAIGSHLGKPIYKTITQQDKTYIFDRLAKCDRDGCPLDQLNKNELLFNPGLIYKEAS